MNQKLQIKPMSRCGLAFLILSQAAGCTTGFSHTLRFANRRPVEQINDRLDTPKPKRRVFVASLYHVDNFFLRRLTRVLEVPAPQQALDVNSLGEVPNSTWFTNRLGVRDVSPAEILAGPGKSKGADRSKPWKVTGTKVGGASVGLLFRDGRGEKYLLKFDQPGIPDLETGADVVAQRLLWAVGYNVPEDNIAIIDRAQLSLAEGAEVEDLFGNKRPMTEADIEERLGRVNRLPGNRIRTLTSKFLPGYPIGGFSQEGRRGDDPNDLIPHEDRRTVRAMRVFFAWLGHTDVKEDNVLDMWVKDPSDPNKHFIVHYLVDFGESLRSVWKGGKVRKQWLRPQQYRPVVRDAIFVHPRFVEEAVGSCGGLPHCGSRPI